MTTFVLVVFTVRCQVWQYSYNASSASCNSSAEVQLKLLYFAAQCFLRASFTFENDIVEVVDE